jgi:hypothetical protein
VANGICQCGTPCDKLRLGLCNTCYHKQRPRIPCTACGKPTGYVIGRSATSKRPMCQPCRQEIETKTCCTKCDRPSQARSLCRTHYSAWQRSQPGHDRKRYDRKVEINCELCGSPKLVNAQHADVQRFCSLSCAAKGSENAAARQYRERVERGHYLRYEPKPKSAKPHRGNPNPIPNPVRAFKSGQCRICSTWYVTLYLDATCSAECQEAKRRIDKQMGKDKRRAVKRKAFVANVYKRKVFESDGYRCHLCGKLCDKTKTVPHHKAPTVDHVIPLAAGGTHEPSNCRTAHFICNSRKSYLGGGEQFALDLTG